MKSQVRLSVRSINQSNRSISVRLSFLFCSRAFISRSYENRSIWTLSYALIFIKLASCINLPYFLISPTDNVCTVCLSFLRSFCICTFSIVSFLTLKAPVSTYKFSKLISIHFLKELVERICSKIQSIFSWVIILLILITYLFTVYG